MVSISGTIRWIYGTSITPVDGPGLNSAPFIGFVYMPITASALLSFRLAGSFNNIL
jgi:hypothetical protein